MGKYQVDKIVDEDIDGILSKVKYIKTCNKETFIEWLKILKKEDYIIIRHNKSYCLLNDRYDETDVVKLESAIPIKISWIKSIFPDYFKIYGEDTED